MITVVCATHRPKNVTFKVVEKYLQLLQQRGEDCQLLEMAELPKNFLFEDSFGKRTQATDQLIADKILPADRLVIVSPEYNGSYPGVLKAFFDAVKPHIWKAKKVALVGVASGRAGNIRGMDHLTHVLHHLRMEVFSNKVPISKIEGLLNEEGELVDEETIAVLQKQIDEFLRY